MIRETIRMPTREGVLAAAQSIAAILPPGFWVLLGIMLLFSWVAFVGVVRAEFLRARNFEYVNAARALGVGDWTIMTRHLLPNAMVATLTFLPFILNGSITTLTSLDFLGFGLPPGSPSLGELLAQGKNNLQAPWLGFSGFFVNITSFLLVKRTSSMSLKTMTMARNGGLVIVSALLMGETITTLEAVGYSGLLFFFSLYTAAKSQEGKRKETAHVAAEVEADPPAGRPLCGRCTQSEER